MTSSGDLGEDRPLYERDPDQYLAYLAEGNRTQPRKRVGADVLFRDEAGRVLLVRPRYKPNWDLPGGMAEANEAPLDAARREVAEELGIGWSGGQLLVVDWVPPHGPWDDSLMFIFDGGVLTGAEQAGLALSDDELQGFQFWTVQDAREALRSYVWQRMVAALAAVHGVPRYLHHGGTAGASAADDGAAN
jgi:ADP-ribose pyrophosphatase YjhB (NUDIX family)